MPSLTAPTQGLTLASRRRELGLSQDDIADACGTSQKTVSKWENGGHRPTKLGHRETYAAALRWTVDELDESITLTARLRVIDFPGWECLVQITRSFAAASRTPVPQLKAA